MQKSFGPKNFGIELGGHPTRSHIQFITGGGSQGVAGETQLQESKEFMKTFALYCKNRMKSTRSILPISTSVKQIQRVLLQYCLHMVPQNLEYLHL